MDKTILTAHDKFTLRSVFCVLRIIHRSVGETKTITDKDMEALEASSWLIKDLLDTVDQAVPSDRN